MKRVYGGNSVQAMIRDLVNEKPNISVIYIVQTLGITIRDANIAIKKLLEQGLIEEAVNLKTDD